MRFQVTVRNEGGAFVARAAEVRGYEGRGTSVPAAVEQLRAGLVFWLEVCPCDVTAADGVTLDVHEA